jgi:hypothetical protein
MSSENIMTISKVEGSLIEASKNLHRLIPTNSQQQDMRQAAIEELKEYQTETIHSLRILFEGDEDGHNT